MAQLRQLSASDCTPTALTAAEVPANTVKRSLILEFGSPDAEFDALIPLGYTTREGGALKPFDTTFPGDLTVTDGSKPVLYFRCNGGHYFCGVDYCPHDAWSHDGIVDTVRAFTRARDLAVVPRPSEFVAENHRDELLPRVVVAQFGDPRCAFVGLEPMIYVYKGATYRFDETPPPLY